MLGKRGVSSTYHLIPKPLQPPVFIIAPLSLLRIGMQGGPEAGYHVVELALKNGITCSFSMKSIDDWAGIKDDAEGRCIVLHGGSLIDEKHNRVDMSLIEQYILN